MFYNTEIFVLTILFWEGCCKPSTTIKHQLQEFEDHVNASLLLDREDKLLANAWTEDLQLKLVNITAQYRLQVTRHYARSFRKNLNQKWTDCMEVHKKEIKRTERLYYEKESDCLKAANSADKDKKHAIKQVEKEIRKWRKGYKYLKSLCSNKHVDDDGKYEICLVEYMLKDNYNVTLQRLILLKLQLMKELFIEMEAAKIKLDDCLETEFSMYLEGLRKIMSTLNRCNRVSIV